MSKLKNKILLIVLLSLVLRVFNLSTNRPSLTNDEAAIGYNAYSILHTLKDEHGEFLPVVFKSFGDWKPGLYIYTTVPFVAALGMTEMAVRLPSALAGVLAVYLLYRIVLLLFDDKRLALFSAFFLSINPWHIHFSRGAWEANLSLTLLLLGTLFFFKSFKKNSYLLISSLFFALTLWTYQSAKLASFLVLLVLVVVYRKEIIKIKVKHLSSAVLVGFLISLPVVFSIVSGKGGRLEVMSVFSYPRPQEYIQTTIYDQSKIDSNKLFFNVFHSEQFNLARGVFGRYFNHFSGRFLFFEGDWSNPKHTSPYVGYFILLDVVFLISGLYFIFKNKINKPLQFFLLWLATAPLASALSRDSVHGVRALNMVIPLVFVIAYGASSISKYLGKKKLATLIFGIVFIPLYGFFYLRYLDSYYVHAPIENAADYLYGYKQVVNKILPTQDKYKQIVFKQSYDQPYIYFLFYGKYDPNKFQENTSYEENKYGDVGKINSLDNIVFRNINWSSDKKLKHVLFVGRETDFPMYEIVDNPDYKYDTIKYPDGDTAFITLEVLNTHEDK